MYLIEPDVRTNNVFALALSVFPNPVLLSLSSLVYREMSEVKRF